MNASWTATIASKGTSFRGVFDINWKWLVFCIIAFVRLLTLSHQ
jgi:hypothetical protein